MENSAKVTKRGLIITWLCIILIFIVIGLWIYGSIEIERLTNRTYQYTWFISIPFSFFLLLFPAMVLVSSIFNILSPMKFMKKNSKYYSYNKPAPIQINRYPNVTIIIPVYREDLGTVIGPTIDSLLDCKNYYTHSREHPINVNIIVNDDGLQVIDEQLKTIVLDSYLDLTKIVKVNLKKRVI